MKNDRKIPPVFKIVIWTIVFWPVGLFYLLKRAELDLDGGGKYSRIVEGIGYFFVIIGFFALMAIFFAEKGAMIWGIMCGLIYMGGGCLLVKKSNQIYRDWRNSIQQHNDVGCELSTTNSKDDVTVID